jgi:formate-dependent nitrite reductase membrane component NrfD
MISRNIPIVGEEFILGYRPQNEWQGLIATAFFLGKIGGGLFLVSMLIQFAAGALAGLVIAVIGKGIAHLLYLGRPERFWRAMAKPGSSWISRGIIGMMVFAVFGFIHIMPYYGWLELGAGTGLWWAIAIIAGFAAFIVMVYDGFVLAASPAIPLWNSSLMPVLCFFYALLGGTTLTIFMLYFLGQDLSGVALLKNIEIWLIVINFIIVVSFLLTMRKSTSAGREAIKLLLTGPFAKLFIGAVIIVGLVVTFLLALYFTKTESMTVLLWITLADLIGHYFIFYLLLRAGLYTPVSSR